MLNISQIEQYYPENLRAFKRNILREYLQYQILEIIFNSSFANKVSFLGGTALRIVYDNTRFSEDLDFDNFGLGQDDFSLLTKEVRQGLEKHGYEVEIRDVFKGAYRCYIKIPKVLFDNGIARLEEEKIMIQIDTMPNYGYLEKKVGIKDEAELKNGLIKQIGTINLEEIAKDVEPFLFHPSDSKRVEMFGEYIGQIFNT